MMDSQETGTVKWFDAQKGFGFIERNGGQGDIFVHATAMEDRFSEPLRDGERVSFEIGPGRKGPAAQNVRRIAS